MKQESGLGCGIAFATPFALTGLAALAKGFRLASSEGFGESTIVALVVGSVFAGVGFGMIAALFQRGKRVVEPLRLEWSGHGWRRWQLADTLAAGGG